MKKITIFIVTVVIAAISSAAAESVQSSNTTVFPVQTFPETVVFPNNDGWPIDVAYPSWPVGQDHEIMFPVSSWPFPNQIASWPSTGIESWPTPTQTFPVFPMGGNYPYPVFPYPYPTC